MGDLILNTNIYSDAAIQVAIDAYKELATISIDKQENYICLSFHECKFDVHLTVKEFENYVIGLENS